MQGAEVELNNLLERGCGIDRASSQEQKLYSSGTRDDISSNLTIVRAWTPAKPTYVVGVVIERSGTAGGVRSVKAPLLSLIVIVLIGALSVTNVSMCIERIELDD